MAKIPVSPDFGSAEDLQPIESAWKSEFVGQVSPQGRDKDHGLYVAGNPARRINCKKGSLPESQGGPDATGTCSGSNVHPWPTINDIIELHAALDVLPAGHHFRTYSGSLAEPAWGNSNYPDLHLIDSDSPIETRPWNIAESIRNWFNGVLAANNPVIGSHVSMLAHVRLHDDVQVIAAGQACLTADTVVVSAGPSYETYQSTNNANGRTGDPILTTAAIMHTGILVCPATNPSCADAEKVQSGDVRGQDKNGNDAILCGADLVVNTIARNEEGNHGLTLTSAWRSPERNEAVGGVINSRHQWAGAVDVSLSGDLILDDGSSVVPARLYCLLEHVSERMLESAYGMAQDDARQSAISEHRTEAIPCTDGNNKPVTHLHVELR